MAKVREDEKWKDRARTAKDVAVATAETASYHAARHSQTAMPLVWIVGAIVCFIGFAIHPVLGLLASVALVVFGLVTQSATSAAMRRYEAKYGDDDE